MTVVAGGATGMALITGAEMIVVECSAALSAVAMAGAVCGLMTGAGIRAAGVVSETDGVTLTVVASASAADGPVESGIGGSTGRLKFAVAGTAALTTAGPAAVTIGFGWLSVDVLVTALAEFFVDSVIAGLRISGTGADVLLSVRHSCHAGCGACVSSTTA